MKTKTVAELVRDGKVIRRYVLKQDEKGYYFDGMHCSSFRRKTLASLEKYANQHKFDVYETEAA
jgi:hypothetical protein